MGMNLDMGLGGGAGFGMAFPGAAGTAAVASPQGPSTAAGAAYGVNMDQGQASGDTKTTGFLSVGTLSLLALVFIWWSLPR